MQNLNLCNETKKMYENIQRLPNSAPLPSFLIDDASPCRPPGVCITGFASQNFGLQGSKLTVKTGQDMRNDTKLRSSCGSLLLPEERCERVPIGSSCVCVSLCVFVSVQMHTLYSSICMCVCGCVCVCLPAEQIGGKFISECFCYRRRNNGSF